MRPSLPTIACALVCAGGALASNKPIVDPAGDASIRRLDPGQSGPINPSATLPDILGIEVLDWAPDDPVADPYTGQVVPSSVANMFRLNLVLDGLVNPPGTLGLGGLPYAPLAFGPSPVYGFVEFDVDNDPNTGGEIGSGALHRPLANATRFASVPPGSLTERAPFDAGDIDTDFFTSPQFERTGQDFSLNLCGCFDVTVVDTFGDTDGSFDAGDTWIVRGRFFQRAGGYDEASAAFGGSFFGSYDPLTDLRFSHDPASDTTTVSLVFPLNMDGAAALAGEPVQPIDLDVSNHASVVEALDDIIAGAGGALFGPTEVLTKEWNDDNPFDFLDADDWDVSAIVGMPYTVALPELYVWTDVAGNFRAGDFDGSAMTTPGDRMLLAAEIVALDGGPSDADATVDGRVTIIDPGPGFSGFDVDGDSDIDAADALATPVTCSADADGDGVVDTSDITFVIFRLDDTGVPGLLTADVTLDGVVDLSDLTWVIFRLGPCP